MRSSPLFVLLALAASCGADDQRLEPSRNGVLAKAPPEARRNGTSTERPRLEPRQEDFIEAANFGFRAMTDLYLVKEPKLYSMGLFLSQNNPARYVAAFNDQSAEAKHLAKFGFAALEAARKIRSKFPNILRQTISQTNGESLFGEQCPKKGIPQCTPASLRYRTSDGSCNNLKELWWGSAMSTMQRFLPPLYNDGVDSIRRSVTGSVLPSARQVSDHIHKERDAPLVSVTHMLMQWGQFIDHDITATGQSTAFNGSVPQCCLNGGTGFQPAEFMHPDCLPIAVHPQDSHLSKLGVRCLEFVRSGPAPREDCDLGPREQLSQVTSYIDASTVYSSNARRCDSLRIFRNGLMQYGKIQSRRPILPRDDSDLCRRGSLSTNCFRAGDGRLTEQPALISLHVIFLRMHNRLATLLSALNQHWTDERIFQESRKIVGALVQHITYREFLPIVLGPEVMKIFDIELLSKGYFKGYDQSINPNIANAFSSAAYRFGHSLVQHSFMRFNRNHEPIMNNVTIHEEFSNPVNLESAGSVDRILLGLVNQPSQKRDEFISEELTNHLFQTPGFPFGMDLASLNIQRGRDHGIPPFVDWRQPCLLSQIRSWKDLERIMPPEAVKNFKDVYAAPEDIDLFSGGLAEKPVTGGLVGATFACIIAQQFRSLRKGDRFWYENPFTESGFTSMQLQQIRKVTLAQILCRTLDNIDSVQPFVMLSADDIKNKRLSCDDPLLDQINLDPWIEDPLTGRESPFPTDGADKDEEEIISIIGHEDAQARVAPAKKFNQRFTQRPNPVKSAINQQNRIVVKRPIGQPGENITIIVNNHAVHSPIIIRDSVHSNFHINQPSNPGSQVNMSNVLPDYQKPTTASGNFVQLKPSTQKPTTSSPGFVQLKPSTQKPTTSSPGFVQLKPSTQKPTTSSPGFVQLKPSTQKPTTSSGDFVELKPSTQKPTTLSGDFIQLPTPMRNQMLSPWPDTSFFQTRNPYYPHNYQDQSNPDPPDYGFNSKPLNNFIPSNEFFSYNLSNLINSIRPQVDSFYETPEGFHFIKKKPMPTHGPYLKPSTEQYDCNQYQQESVLTTKKPNSVYRPNVKLTSSSHGQNTNSNLPSKLQGSYSHIHDRFSENPYVNLEPNQSDRDEFNPNYQSRPSKKPADSFNSYSNQRNAEMKPPNKQGGSYYDSKRTITKAPTQQNLRDSNINVKPQLYSLHSSLLNLPIDKPLQKSNDNGHKTEEDHQMLHYLHIHATESTIKYASNNKITQKQTSGIHQELPRPLVKQEYHHSEDEIKNSSNTVAPTVIEPLEQSLIEQNEPTFKNTDQEIIDFDNHNTRIINEELKFPMSGEIVINKIDPTLSKFQKILERNLSRIINSTSPTSLNSKVPLIRPIESTTLTKTNNELPRPIKMRAGN